MFCVSLCVQKNGVREKSLMHLGNGAKNRNIFSPPTLNADFTFYFGFSFFIPAFKKSREMFPKGPPQLGSQVAA